MKLIVGLGNPGTKYSNTRHNVGFILVDRLVAVNTLVWEKNQKFNAEFVKDAETMYAKPQTYMNNSGDTVSKIVNFYNLDPQSDLIVIHDDVDLELGTVKIQNGRGSAGHRGVEDISAKLGTLNFTRVRVGIGRPQDTNIAIEDWVLMPFAPDELDVILSLGLDFSVGKP